MLTDFLTTVPAFPQNVVPQAGVQIPLHLSTPSTTMTSPSTSLAYSSHIYPTSAQEAWILSTPYSTLPSSQTPFSASDSPYLVSTPSLPDLSTPPPLSSTPPKEMANDRQQLTVSSLASMFWSLLSLSIFNTSMHRDHTTSERNADLRWIATSHSWLDRQACRLIGICGFPHFFGHERNVLRDFKCHEEPQQSDWRSFQQSTSQSVLSDMNDVKQKVEEHLKKGRVIDKIPQYILDYAPYVHLYSEEEYWPGDIAEHLEHITPYHDYEAVKSYPKPLNLTNLNLLDIYGRHVYLQSDDNVEDKPDWLLGRVNIPKGSEEFDDYPFTPPPYDEYLEPDLDAEGSDWAEAGEGSLLDVGGDPATGRSRPPKSSMLPPQTTEDGPEIVIERSEEPSTDPLPKRRVGGRSDAPAILVCVDKGNGIVDALWFFFYSFNLGNSVLNVRFGNHVGDWEHTAIRFQDGEPKAVFFSEHSFGDAYSYDAVEKIGKRPVSYSASGTHAMYATPGIHSYVLPWGLLHDVTDRGPLWDPVLNSHMYTYDYINDTLRASNFTPNAPLEWFYYIGRWGDKTYPLDDPRQYRFLDQYHYESGPTGPRFKNLGRKKICQGNGACKIKHWKIQNKPGPEGRRKRRRGS